MRSLRVRILGGERGAVVGLGEWAVVDGVGGHELSHVGTCGNSRFMEGMKAVGVWRSPRCSAVGLGLRLGR